MSAAEDQFALHLKAHGIPFEREYQFAKSMGRRWRADFFIEPDVLVEIEGGVFVQGRHTRGAAFVSDAEKYNAAALLGYRVFRFVPRQHVATGIAVDVIRRALESAA